MKPRARTLKVAQFPFLKRRRLALRRTVALGVWKSCYLPHGYLLPCGPKKAV